MTMTIEAPIMDERTPADPVTVPDYSSPGRRDSSLRPDYLMPDLCAEKPAYRRIWLGVAIVIVALYGILIFRFWGPADEGVDQNAYLVGGRLLAEHFSMKYTLPNPYSYTGGMMVRMTKPDVPGGEYYPKYPFGLPLLYAGFFWVFKLAAALPFLKHHVNPDQAAYWAFLVSPVSSILAIAGMFALARQIAGSFTGMLATILLGSSQLMMMLAENPNSHASCLAFIVWGMFFCVRWLQTGSHWRGILGGLLVGYAATIRYNEGMLFASMCMVVLGRLPWNQLKTWRSASLAPALVAAIWACTLQANNHSDMMLKTGMITVFLLYVVMILGLSIAWLRAGDWMMYLRAIVPGLAWSVPVGVLMLVNHHTIGSFTGYDSTNESEFGVAFQWKFFFQNWEKVLRIVDDMGLFFVLPFAVAGIFMLFRRSWRVAMMLVLWIVPGVMLYMSYYWSPDFADAYARFFLTYLPALLVGTAVCFQDGLLRGGKESGRYGGIALTLSAGLVVAIASSVSMYRTIHGLRDGSQSTKVPLTEFHHRLALAQTGQMLLENVPEHSVLFAQDTGGIATPSNYIQFLRDWELYGADTFSVDGSRRGMGGGGGNRQRNGRNNNNNANNNFRGGGVGGGNRGGGFGAGGFNGGGLNGGPPGGGFGGPGGGGGGMNGGPGIGALGVNNNQIDPTTVTATPTQPEQREYHARLYQNKSARQLYQLEADVIQNAYKDGRRVFVAVAKDHATTEAAIGNLYGNGSFVTDPMESFRENLNEVGKYQYKVIKRWQDVSVPDDKNDDFVATDNNPMGGGGRGRGGANMFGQMLLGNDRVMDWQLVEIKSPVVRVK